MTLSAWATVKPDAPLRERVAAIIDTLYHGLASQDSRAIENLRAALPREHHGLERLYPRTAAEPISWGKSWQETCQNAFADLGVDPQRVREVAAHPRRDARPGLRAPTGLRCQPR